MAQYEPVIGLEVHIELKTKSKMFCACPAHGATVPNTQVCPVCLAHPGTLPVPNKEAVWMGVRFGTALGCRINTTTKFDRKNYFYPDLPKGYQISQYDVPVGEDGHIQVALRETDGTRTAFSVRIHRAHLEEDAAKNIHDGTRGKTLVDYNRSGVPLIEMVSEPDMHTPAQAKAYLQEVQRLARALGISDADMEKGHLRCDANISLRPVKEDGSVDQTLYPKTEIKNVNSFRAVERALTHEIERQTTLWEAGTPPMESTTRGWNDVTGETVPQRNKEGEADYRYFPDPDLPPLDLTSLAEEAKSSLPELPAQKRLRLKEEYGLSDDDADLFVDQPELGAFAEEVYSELAERAWIPAATSWIVNKWNRKPVTAENMAEFMALVAKGAITTQTAAHILEVMTETGKDPSHIMEDEGLGRVQDEHVLAELVDKVLEENPGEVARYKGGEKKLLAFFMGIVMKETEGRADPALTRNMLLVKLES